MTKPIPKGPWTVETLGEPEYCRLANEYGCFNPGLEPKDYRPPLDLVAVYAAQEEKNAKAAKPNSATNAA